MRRFLLRKVIRLVKRAQRLAQRMGIANILQPGLIKEMIIAEILGHKLMYSKRDADACDPTDPSIKYEYLSCFEGGAGQIDRVFARPEEMRKRSLDRILRNKYIYLVVFYKSNPLSVKVIYEIDPKAAVEEADKQLDRSKNDISHISFSEKWAKEKGTIGTVLYVNTKPCYTNNSKIMFIKHKYR